MASEEKRTSRISRLVQSCAYDERTAASMVDATQWLSDAEFAAHADYLAEKRALMKQATRQGEKDTVNQPIEAKQAPAKLPPKATDLPAPMSGKPAKVGTASSTLAKDVDDFMSQVFGLDDEEENEPSASPAKEHTQGKGGSGQVRAAIEDYMSREIFQLEDDTSVPEEEQGRKGRK